MQLDAQTNVFGHRDIFFLVDDLFIRSPPFGLIFSRVLGKPKNMTEFRNSYITLVQP